MFLQTIKDFDIYVADSWLIGDKDLDIIAGKKTGPKTILVLTGEGPRPLGFSDVKPQHIAKGLVEAAGLISI